MSTEFREPASWRHAILLSDLPATSRHLLLTISLHFNDYGEGIFPSVEQLASETNLAERTVSAQIERAYKSGWLTIDPDGFSDSRSHPIKFRPEWPDLKPKKISRRTKGCSDANG